MIVWGDLYSQSYDLLSNELVRVPISQLKKPETPLDLFHFEDGITHAGQFLSN